MKFWWKDFGQVYHGNEMKCWVLAAFVPNEVKRARQLNECVKHNLVSELGTHLIFLGKHWNSTQPIKQA